MRGSRGGEPAEQLRSVAGRYRFPLGCRPSAGRRPWDAELQGARLPQGTGALSPTARDAKLQRLEAVLFLAREPLSSRKLAQYVALQDGTEARTLVRQLNRLYDVTGRAFRVEEVAGGFQLLTRPKFASWLRRMGHVPAELRLSGPVLETLAVIAYRQPVLRADIEAIRGVNCGEILRQLLDRDLIRVCGRSEELGRPYLYGTTKKFLQLFGLSSIDKLPPMATMPDISPANDVTAHQTVVDGEPGSSENSEAKNGYQQREENKVTATIFPEVRGVAGNDELTRQTLIVAQRRSRRRDEDEEDEYEDYEEDEDFEEDEDLEEDEDFEEEEDFDEEDFDEEEDFEDEDYEEDEFEEDEDWEALDEEEEEEEYEEEDDPEEEDEDLDDWDEED